MKSNQNKEYGNANIYNKIDELRLITMKVGELGMDNLNTQYLSSRRKIYWKQPTKHKY
jgi:hypothetical protein